LYILAGALKLQVLENTSTENLSIKQDILQVWKLQVWNNVTQEMWKKSTLFIECLNRGRKKYNKGRNIEGKHRQGMKRNCLKSV